MREISKHIPRTAREGYNRPGGPAPADKVSPLRGLKQRWTCGGGDFFRTRANAMRFRRKYNIDVLPERVFV